ncbi:MAG: hypothetical protein ACJA2C_001650 [Marinoscillum sp.]|jgi:hypothetical protein
MNLKQKKYFYLLIILVFLGIIVSSVFYLLGGFKEVMAIPLEGTTRTLAGKRFVTHYTDEKPREFGKECRELLADSTLDGRLVVVNYHSDTLERDQIHQFIGIALSEEMSEIPQGFEILELESSARYAVFLTMHVIVQPRPNKIEALLFAKAQEDGMELDDFFLELWYPDNSLVVEGWVKP